MSAHVSTTPPAVHAHETHAKPYVEATQQHMDACCSVMMVGFPLPPLPIMCLQGSDNNDGAMSSHDLLARCIACAMLQEQGTHAPDTSDFERHKMGCLQQCWNDIEQISPDSVEDLYRVFCTYTRKYIGLYLQQQSKQTNGLSATSDPDLRFQPFSYVAADDKIVKQTKKHFTARLEALLAAGEISNQHFKRFHSKSLTTSYTSLVCLYADEFVGSK